MLLAQNIIMLPEMGHLEAPAVLTEASVLAKVAAVAPYLF